MATVGRNHYVVRLGTVSAVGARSIPILMRDCLTVSVDPESVAVLSGHVPTHHDESATVASAAATAAVDGAAAAAGVNGGVSSSAANGGGGGIGAAVTAARRSRDAAASKAAKAASAAAAAAAERASLGNHVSSLVAAFANAGKPLVFSLLEIRETKRRDHWRVLLVEMAAAHRLHAALGYGTAGRLTRRAVDAAAADADADGGMPASAAGDALGAATAATLKAVSPAMVGGGGDGGAGGTSASVGGRGVRAGNGGTGDDGGDDGGGGTSAGSEATVGIGIGDGLVDVPRPSPALTEAGPLSAAAAAGVPVHRPSSPYEHDFSSPLLAVFAHVNCVRYRALRRATGRRSRRLLVFSNPAARLAGLGGGGGVTGNSGNGGGGGGGGGGAVAPACVDGASRRRPPADGSTLIPADAWAPNPATEAGAAVAWYLRSVRTVDGLGERSWVSRALSAIRENISVNVAMYEVRDDAPFDMATLGDNLSRLFELLAPLGTLADAINGLVQWRNPPASVLGLLAALFVAHENAIAYLPAAAVAAAAGTVLYNRAVLYGLDGVGGGGADGPNFWSLSSPSSPAAEGARLRRLRKRQAARAAERRRAAGVVAMLSAVHGTLHGVQNGCARLNRQLGKVEVLALWAVEADSWKLVGSLIGVAAVLALLPVKVLYVTLVLFLFGKHFLPPNNPALRWWLSVPSVLPPLPPGDRLLGEAD